MKNLSLNRVMADCLDELNPAHDLDRLEKITSLHILTSGLESAYNRIQSAKHLTRGAVFGVLLGNVFDLPADDIIKIMALTATMDIIQYTIRANLWFNKNGK